MYRFLLAAALGSWLLGEVHAFFPLPSTRLKAINKPASAARSPGLPVFMTIKIDYAEYGGTDVRAKLEGMLSGDKNHLVVPIVDQDSLGTPNRAESLKISYRLDSGPPYTPSIPTGSALVINEYSRPIGDNLGWRGPDREEPLKTLGSVPKQALSWSVKDGDLTLQGPVDVNPMDKEIIIKGVNWFGIEGGWRLPGGLYSFDGAPHSVADIAGFLKYYGFNAVRLPISLPVALNLQGKGPNFERAKGFQPTVHPELAGKSYSDQLRHIIKSLGDQGILVMLDMHRLRDDEESLNNDADELIGSLWHNSWWTEADFILGWEHLLAATADLWNVFAIDLKNEPHTSNKGGPFGRGALWEKADQKSRGPQDWNLFAELLIDRIVTRIPQYQGLFFVEGVQRGESGWGGSTPNDGPLLNSKGNERVVYSPHAYGPSVSLRTGEPQEGDPGKWAERWQHLKEPPKKQAVVLGEWGGYNTRTDKQTAGDRGPHDDSKDGAWHRNLVEFLKEKQLTSQFYWCLNPDSGDTGGIIRNINGDPNSWPPRGSGPAFSRGEVDKDKLKLLSNDDLFSKKHPSTFTWQGSTLNLGRFDNDSARKL